jgi:hypothetical protein
VTDLDKIPDWVPAAHRERLNGHSAHRTAFRMRFVLAGDGLCGTVVGVRRAAPTPAHPEGATVLVVRAEAGQTEGQPIHPGTWLDVFMTPTDLRRFYEAHEPREGDEVSIVYGGAVGREFGAARKSFACGFERGERKDEEDW